MRWGLAFLLAHVFVLSSAVGGLENWRLWNSTFPEVLTPAPTPAPAEDLATAPWVAPAATPWAEGHAAPQVRGPQSLSELCSFPSFSFLGT